MSQTLLDRLAGRVRTTPQLFDRVRNGDPVLRAYLGMAGSDNASDGSVRSHRVRGFRATGPATLLVVVHAVATLVGLVAVGRRSRSIYVIGFLLVCVGLALIGAVLVIDRTTQPYPLEPYVVLPIAPVGSPMRITEPPFVDARLRIGVWWFLIAYAVSAVVLVAAIGVRVVARLFDRRGAWRRTRQAMARPRSERTA